MRTWVPANWLLLAIVLFPSVSLAQAPPSSYSVSVRELSIPARAMHSFRQGAECLARKDEEASLSHFQRATAEFAGYYEAYDAMGTVYLKLWRIPEAEQAFRKSIELSGGHYAHPLLALGAILDDRKEFAEAETVTRMGLDLNPDSWRGQYYLGLALSGLNRLQEAEKNLLEALRQKADFAEARLLLADIHSREKNYRALVNDLDEYLQIAPDGPAKERATALRESALRILFVSQSAAAITQLQP
jgi:tetratricopeptide (TPR) repeat protein